MARKRAQAQVHGGQSTKADKAKAIMLRLEPIVRGERRADDSDFEELENLLELKPYWHHRLVMAQFPEADSQAYETWVRDTQDDDSRKRRRGFAGRVSTGPGQVW